MARRRTPWPRRSDGTGRHRVVGRSVLPGSAGRRRSLRRRAGAWVLVGLAALGVQRSVASAAATRAAWSDRRPVVVLDRTVATGGRLDHADVHIEQLPAAALPDDALTSLPDESTAAVTMHPGTVLARSFLQDGSRSPTARALRPGRVGVVVRTGELPRVAAVGDRVDVASPGWDGPVATSATVVHVAGDAVTLEVRESEASATAAASLSGPVALLVRP